MANTMTPPAAPTKAGEAPEFHGSPLFSTSAPGPDAQPTEQKAKPPITHVIVVVDESGSMSPLADDVRGGFNEYIAGLRAQADARFRATVTLFNRTVRTLCAAAKPKDVPALTASTYRPGDSTSLLDAIGGAVAEFDRAVPKLGDGERVLVVVQTDGQENTSVEYKLADIRKLITDREQTGRWQFVFLGAGPDTWTQGSHLGFAAHNTVGTFSTGLGTRSGYAGMAAASAAYAAGADNESTSKQLREAMGDQAHH